MKRLAARVGDTHLCPNHGGSPLSPPGAAQVFIGGVPAARVLNPAACPGAADMVLKGAPMVLIEGLSAARKADPTAHGGCILVGSPTVIIGGVVPPTTDEEAINDAMNLIRTSDFAQTEEGKLVLAKLEKIHAAGKLTLKDLGPRIRGEYSPPILGMGEGIAVSQLHNRDPNYIASNSSTRALTG